MYEIIMFALSGTALIVLLLPLGVCIALTLQIVFDLIRNLKGPK
jgi:hypothetical protein